MSILITLETKCPGNDGPNILATKYCQGLGGSKALWNDVIKKANELVDAYHIVHRHPETRSFVESELKKYGCYSFRGHILNHVLDKW